MLTHRRAIGDTRSLFRVDLQVDGVAVDLSAAGTAVKFEMYDEAGNVIVNRAAANIVSPSTGGHVSYDFQAADVDAPGVFYGRFIVTDNTGEVDSYPDDETGIQITMYDPASNKEEPAPSLDILTLANAPIRTRTVEGTVEERSVNELIKADQYTAGKTAANAGVPWGIRTARTRPGGMVT